jgi:hypothetical protein
MTKLTSPGCRPTNHDHDSHSRHDDTMLHPLHAQENSVVRCAKPRIVCDELNAEPVRVKAWSIRRASGRILSGNFRYLTGGSDVRRIDPSFFHRHRRMRAPDVRRTWTVRRHETVQSVGRPARGQSGDKTRPTRGLLRRDMSISRQILLMSSGSVVMELKHLLHTISRKFN